MRETQEMVKKGTDALMKKIPGNLSLRWEIERTQKPNQP